MRDNRRVLIAVVCGVAAAVLSMVFLTSAQQEALTARAQALDKLGSEQTEVVVTAREFVAGEPLNSNDLVVVPYLSAWVPEGAITSLEDIEGRRTGVSLAANQVITELSLVQDSKSDIPSGYVALSVPTQDVRAVGGKISAGDEVDVYVLADTEARLLLSRAVVRDTSQTVERTRAGMNWVTLLVPDDKVASVMESAAAGSIYLTLPESHAHDGAEPQGEQEVADNE